VKLLQEFFPKLSMSSASEEIENKMGNLVVIQDCDSEIEYEDGKHSNPGARCDIHYVYVISLWMIV
jgi:hypothetical protein